ncbi:MAG TPA: DUF2298 domain-containing protein [Methylomirabilota bacterium]
MTTRTLPVPALPVAGVVLVALPTYVVAAGLPPSSVAAMLVTFALMAFAGIAVLRRALPDERSPLCLFVFGSVLGLLLGRVGLILAGIVPALHSHALLFVSVAAAVVGAVFARDTVRPWTEADRREFPVLACVCAVMLLLLTPPLSRLGVATERGYAFVAHFNTDLFQHAAVTAEVMRGLPPQNPWFVGEALHYYWFFHLWPASLASLTGVPARDAILVTIPVTVVLFVAALALVLRAHVTARLPRYFGIGLGLVAYSYIGLLVVVRLVAPRLLDLAPKYFTGEYTLLSHSWYRDLLYEPHAVTALAALLFALYLDRAPGPRPGASILVGLALGTTVMTDSFIGVIGLASFGLVYAWRFVRDPRRRWPALLTLATIVTVLAGALALHVFPTSRGAVAPGPHPIFKFAPAYLLVDLGPILIFGVIGLALIAARSRIREHGLLVAILLVSLAVSFLIIVPLDPNTALRKGLKTLQIPLVVFAAEGAAAYLVGRRRRWLSAAAGMVVLAGAVTLVTDISQYIDVRGGSAMPTTYLSADEADALEWVRRNTPPGAVFQVVSEVRPGSRYRDTAGSLVCTFGERRTLSGDYKAPEMFQVDAATIARRRARLEEMFLARDPDVVRAVLHDLGPDYLYMDDRKPGPVEPLRELETTGALKEIYSANHIHILAVSSRK